MFCFRSAISRLALAFTALTFGTLAFVSSAPAASAKTAIQSYVEAMQPGLNYGNTYDAAPNETSWGNAAITQAYAEALVAKGYKSIRMTVTWRDHMGPAPTYTIDPAWMAKIQQAVDISLNAGLYVLLNAHHDAGWVYGYGTDPVGVGAKFDALWTQIAAQFKDYPTTLSFESINEPGIKDANGNDLPDAEMAAGLAELNTSFVHVVRASGGHNATRPLVLPTVYTRGDAVMVDSLKATIANLNDPNLIATMHYYGWWPFSVNNSGYTAFNDLVAFWVRQGFDDAYNSFVADGIPVIIGEFGVLAGNNIEHGELLKYYEYVTYCAPTKGLTLMLWDTGGINDRSTGAWRDPELGAVMTQAWTGRATTAASDLLFIRPGAAKDAVVNLNLNGNTFVSLTEGATTLTRDVDYELQGSTLTIKGSRLAQYATGSFGEKTVFSVNVNSGPAWNIHVRYADAPVVSPVTGTNGGEFLIPTAFNGDLLAALEATDANGDPVGPLGWTKLKGWGDFLPDYANSAIKLTAGFVKDLPTGIINLKFYFWSGQVLSYQLEIKTPSASAGSDYVIYGDGLATGWSAAGAWGGWGANENLASTTEVHSGLTSISTSPVGWSGLLFANGTPTDTSIYRTLVFWIHGGTTGGQSLGFGVIPGGDWGITTNWISIKPVANTWQKVEVPLASLGVEGRTDIDHFEFADWSGSGAATFYIDDIKLSTSYASWQLVITGTPVAATPPVTTFAVKGRAIHRDNGANRLLQTVQVVNTGKNPASGPIHLVLDGLSTSTTLLNATGSTENIVPAGAPYLTLAAASIAPGKSVSVTLEFSIPTPDTHGTPGGNNLNVVYTPRVLSNGAKP